MSDHQAKGTFEAKVNREPSFDTVEGISLGRATVEKQFRGALEATSIVYMLTAGESATGSAGYVAIERVTGSLDARSGTFVLMHAATMGGGKHSLAISVVPDSGTGALKTIAGAMTIEIVDGKHSYSFDYSLVGA